MEKNYIIETSVLMDNPESIKLLRNGNENNIYIPKTTIEEIDSLKHKENKKYLALKVIDAIEKYKDLYEILDTEKYSLESNDNKILKEIKKLDNIEKYTFVTNDRLFKIKCEKEGIVTEVFKTSNPFKSETEKYSGFIELYGENGKIEDWKKYKNTFHFTEYGNLNFYNANNNLLEEVPNNLELWKIKSWDVYQNALYYSLLQDDILIHTISGDAGSGKTTVTLAYALQKIFQEKQFKKLIITTSNVEVTNTLGFLPGTLTEKFEPFIYNIKSILIKLHQKRNCKKLFIDPNLSLHQLEFNPKYIEFIPLNYMRGMDFDNCIVFADELQNLNKIETKTLLSRCGKNSKFIGTGDINQIDNYFNNSNNNGINWVLKSFKNHNKYCHITLKSKKSPRGEICQMTNDLFK